MLMQKPSLTSSCLLLPGAQLWSEDAAMMRLTTRLMGAFAQAGLAAEPLDPVLAALRWGQGEWRIAHAMGCTDPYAAVVAARAERQHSHAFAMNPSRARLIEALALVHEGCLNAAARTLALIRGQEDSGPFLALCNLADAMVVARLGGSSTECGTYLDAARRALGPRPFTRALASFLVPTSLADRRVVKQARLAAFASVQAREPARAAAWTLRPFLLEITAEDLASAPVMDPWELLTWQPTVEPDATAVDTLPVVLIESRPDPAAHVRGVLTRRELEVARLVAEGMTNHQIATALGISRWTVVNHVRRVMNKLGVSSRVEVAVRLLSEVTPSSGSAQP